MRLWGEGGGGLWDCGEKEGGFVRLWGEGGRICEILKRGGGYGNIKKRRAKRKSMQSKVS